MCLNKMLRLTKSAAMFSLLLAANNVSAQAPVVATTQQTKKEVLTGTITDAATKKAISGASVAVSGFSAAITDDKGAFKLNVPLTQIIL